MRYIIETVEQTLQNVMGCLPLFRGKYIIQTDLSNYPWRSKGTFDRIRLHNKHTILSREGFTAFHKMRLGSHSQDANAEQAYFQFLKLLMEVGDEKAPRNKD